MSVDFYDTEVSSLTFPSTSALSKATGLPKSLVLDELLHAW